MPIAKNRTGQCKRCGTCCKLPNRCFFLDTDQNDKCICKIYAIRPPACRKYPRSPSEHITTDSCGYVF
ncbi:MAG: YkgJ family cysteine cluster protein [Planctomycetota bacterium]